MLTYFSQVLCGPLLSRFQDNNHCDFAMSRFDHCLDIAIAGTVSKGDDEDGPTFATSCWCRREPQNHMSCRLFQDALAESVDHAFTSGGPVCNLIHTKSDESTARHRNMCTRKSQERVNIWS